MTKRERLLEAIAKEARAQGVDLERTRHAANRMANDIALAATYGMAIESSAYQHAEDLATIIEALER